VAFDIPVVIFAHDAEHFATQGQAIGVELSRVFFATALEEIAGGGMELKHQAFFPAGPAVGRGGVGIGERE